MGIKLDWDKAVNLTLIPVGHHQHATSLNGPFIGNAGVC